MRRTRSAIRRCIITRLSRVRLGEKNVSVERKRMANIRRRKTFDSGTPPSPCVGREHVVLAARVVELLASSS